jgi:putative flippase GtrA
LEESLKKMPETQIAVELLPDIQDAVLRPARSWRLLFWQLVRFCIVGVINATIDILALNILLLCFPTHNANILVLYNSAAFTLGALNSYLLNKYWTFHRRQAITGGELLRFTTITVIGFLCNDGIIWIAAHALHPLIANPILWANASKLSAVVGTAIVSYLGMRLWVFAGKPHESEKEREVYSMLTADSQEQQSSNHVDGALDDDEPTQPRKAVSKYRTRWSLSVVLPAYNEEAVIAETIGEVVAALTLWIQDFEVIVINDGSRDATSVILDTIAAANPRVRVIHHPVNKGYGAALVSGFEATTKDLTFFMDSDGQFDIHDLERFFPLIDRYDAVFGYRIDRQDTWMRKLNAWGWKILVGIAFGVHVCDVDCAFKLYRGNFFREHRLETRGAMINTEIIYKFTRAGNTYTQVGVRHLLRRGGRATGAKPSVILRAFRELFIYTRKWLREEQKEGRKEELSQTIEVE